MKKLFTVLTVATLIFSGNSFPLHTLSNAEPDTSYTAEDLRNLRDFLLGRETSDLSGKNYDLDGDGIWSIFDLCMM
ncbi:MAG: hypothetical protein K2G36_03660 [Ruminococcus sp.]|nr:hypothetical protein [Ruminococcus sp.]